MFDLSWVSTSGSELLMVLISALGIYMTLLICVRLSGLRSFAKMSSFDFAVTVATGSVVAATLLTKKPSLSHGAVGLFALFVMQFLVSWLRRNTSIMSKIVDNEPIVLMSGEDVLYANLDRVRMTADDLRSHLRLAGIIHPKQVLAVTMESTGDIAVLRVDNQACEVSPALFCGVIDAEKILERRAPQGR